MKKLLEMSDKELMDLIAKATTDEEIQKILLNSGRDIKDAQLFNSDVLGAFIEDRFGGEDVMTSQDLNKYLSKMKEKDYPGLDRIRQVLYGKTSPIEAAYNIGSFGSGGFNPIPDLEIPIKLGGIQQGGIEFSNKRAKTILAHELAHANDLPAIHLMRLKTADPERYNKLVEQIGNIKGGEQFLDHVNKIAKRYPTTSASDITVDKANILLDTLKDMKAEDPSIKPKIEHYLNKYKKNAEQYISEDPHTIGKDFMKKYMKVDPKTVSVLRGEDSISSIGGIERDLQEKILNAKFNPIKSESLRSHGHHAIRTDIPGDIGHFEYRNIKRLPKGKRLLSKIPIIGPLVGLAIAAYTKDSSAAIPFLSEADSVGPEEGSEDWEIENRPFKKLRSKLNPEEQLIKDTIDNYDQWYKSTDYGNTYRTKIKPKIK